MKKNIIIKILIVMCVFAVAGLFYLSRQMLSDHVEYFAENDFITLEIHNIKDLETFEKVKPKHMTIVNSLQEIEAKGSRLVLGHVYMDDDFYNKDVQYELLIERKNGTTFSVPILVNQWESINGKVEADFFLTDSEDEMYKYLTLLVDGKETVKFKLKQK